MEPLRTRASRRPPRPALQAAASMLQAGLMNRNTKRGATARSAGRGLERRRSDSPAAPPETVEASRFLTLLKRGQLAHPQHTKLRAGRPRLVRPPTGQAASVLQRLERQLAAASA